jgi:hypothetical protein
VTPSKRAVDTARDIAAGLSHLRERIKTMTNYRGLQAYVCEQFLYQDKPKVNNLLILLFFLINTNKIKVLINFADWFDK